MAMVSSALTQVITAVNKAIHSPDFCCIRDLSVTEQALGPILSILNQCEAWERDLQLEFMTSVRLLLPELLPLLDDVGVQLDSTGQTDAS